jgi:hypothetical protein
VLKENTVKAKKMVKTVVKSGRIPGFVWIGAYVPPEEKAALEALAESTGRSMAGALRRLVTLATPGFVETGIQKKRKE